MHHFVIGRAAGLELFNQVFQRFQPDHWIQYILDYSIRLVNGGFRQLEQDIGFAAYTAQIIEQLLLNLVFCTCTNFVNDLN